MSAGPSIRGRRLFIAGAIVLLLFGGVHTLAVFQSSFGAPRGAAEAEIDRLARAHAQRLGPFEFTVHGLIQILNSSYSILLLQTGVLNLLSVGPAAAAGRLKGLTIANVLFTGLLLLVTIVFQFPPPMLFAVAAFALFVASLVSQSRSVPAGGA